MIVMVSLWYVYIVSHLEEWILLYCQIYGTRFERLDCAADRSKNQSVARSTAERKASGSIPRAGPILRVLKVTAKPGY